VNGITPKAITLTMLQNDDIRAHNTFESPDAVTPLQNDIAVSGGSLTHQFAPASVNLFTIQI